MTLANAARTVRDAEGEASALPRRPRIAMWPAPADLAAYVTGLHLYVVDENGGAPNRGAFEPSFAALRIALVGGNTWRVRFVGGEWLHPPALALFGPSSTVLASESGPGVLLNGGLRPRGWLRMFRRSAHLWADRIGQPDILSGRNGADILALLRSLDRDEDVADIYFTLIRNLLGPETAEQAEVAVLEDALVDPAVHTVAHLCDLTGMSIRRLQRLANRAFGFPPKLLLRRARFLRSLNALRGAPRGEGAMAIDPAYTDYSHFVRDAQKFLGMSPQAFIDGETPLLRQSLAMRTEVIGAPSQALDQVAA